ncbi:N-acetylmuramoyl-L-alanine amidase [Tissierella carlieri]|uniref:N-acetylmuramoyl-L-alanine amidase n=1 Tax=Tissierella carlieri TaxID=689904 RepID=A0ABT1SCS1_9FIRM|nr:N-acetylmuramoyl-L-alanine amidase [Tissierella carlieri]MCQ4924278.1 N-acetylmuramoyl-L-alanine amidase [Tissierella carlieri]
MIFRRIRAIFLIIVLILIFFNVFQRFSFLKGDFISSKKVIVIDPGHGGKDSGTISVNNHYEKDINLEIAKKLHEKLMSMDYKVILTRETDEFVDNNYRADMANEKKARIFVSIHGNAIENNNSINGIQVLYYPNRRSTINDSNNDVLAQIMLDELVKGTGATDKGIIGREDLIVLNQTKMPAIIVEYGFLSNENEEKLLLNDSYQDKVVASIVNGLEYYFSLNPEN